MEPNPTLFRHRVLITAPYFLPVIERFRSELEAHGIALVAASVAERLEEDELLPLVEDVDGVICGDDRFTERVLSAAPRLRVLSKWGTGIDSIDQKACERRGVRVCNTPDAFSQPVADSVLGFILCFARRPCWIDRHVKAGHWEKVALVSLAECTVGVIGVGNVGKAVALRVQAFGARLLGNDIVRVSPEFVARVGIEMTSLAALLEQSDFVSVNCTLNPTSWHLIDDEALRRMRPNAVLVNTARGPIVDEAALIRALEQRQIAGAALDVFEQEPLPNDSPLRNMDNVMLAPHNANASPAAWERVHRSTIDNLIRALGEKREP